MEAMTYPGQVVVRYSLEASLGVLFFIDEHGAVLCTSFYARIAVTEERFLDFAS
jgi:hypothetical protein